MAVGDGDGGARLTPSQPLPIVESSGRLRNPLRIGEAAGVESTMAVVQYLSERRATGRVLFVSGPAEVPFLLERGQFLIAAHERDACRAPFWWPEGHWAFTQLAPEKHPGRSPVNAWRICGDAVRARVREAAVEELRDIVDLASAARLGAAFLERSRWLELSPVEEAVAKHDLDGRHSLREVLARGEIAEAGLLRLVVMLQSLGLVELSPPR